MHRNGNKTTGSSNFLFQICQPGVKTGGHLRSFSWKHETMKLYCGNSLLGLELLLFPNLLSLDFILYSVAASFPKMSLSKQKSWQKCRVFQHNWSVSYFLRRWMGYLYVWCAHSRSQWWKNITFDTTMRLNHAERYRGLQGQPRREKVKE